MTGTHTGNRHGLMPARMVGRVLCSEMRQTGTDAGSEFFRTAGKGHDGLFPAPLFILAMLFVPSVAGATSAMPAGRMTAPTTKPSQRQLPPQGKMDPRMQALLRKSAEDQPPTEEELSAARGIEQMMVNLMIEEMRKSVPENEVVPLSQGERVFRQMLDQEHARTMSEAGVLGIADLVLAQMRGKR